MLSTNKIKISQTGPNPFGKSSIELKSNPLHCARRPIVDQCQAMRPNVKCRMRLYAVSVHGEVALVSVCVGMAMPDISGSCRECEVQKLPNRTDHVQSK